MYVPAKEMSETELMDAPNDFSKDESETTPDVSLYFFNLQYTRIMIKTNDDVDVFS